MKKMIISLLAASLLSVNVLNAQPNEGDERTRKNNVTAPDSSARKNDEQALLELKQAEAEEIYYGNSEVLKSNTSGKQSQNDTPVNLNKKGEERKNVSK